jgi:hypothetical protein
MNPNSLTVEDQANLLSDVTAAPFYAVSLKKMSILWLCTLGFYALPWFYMHWKLIKRNESLNINPAARSFFALLFCYSCLSHIKRYGEKLGFTKSFSATSLTIAWTLMMVIGNVKESAIFLALASFVFLLPVQAYANRVNQFVSPQHDMNSRFTRWNWALIALGIPLLMLAIIGTIYAPN